MSDEPMNLEAPPAPVAEALPAAPVVETPADPDEADAVELPAGKDGKAGKYVPLPALQAVRDENKNLRERAGQVDRLMQENAQLRPYAELGQQMANQQRQQPAAPAAPGDDPRLVRLARSLDYILPDGKPDLERAKVHQALVREEAAEMAQQIVGPLAQSTFEERANTNWQKLVADKLPDGRPIDVSLVTAAWQAVAHNNPKLLADARVTRMIANNVKMEQMMASPMGQAAAAPRAPVVTEGSGRPPATKARMTDAERELLSGRNIDDAKYGDLTKGFQPGRMNALED